MYTHTHIYTQYQTLDSASSQLLLSGTAALGALPSPYIPNFPPCLPNLSRKLPRQLPSPAVHPE